MGEVIKWCNDNSGFVSFLAILSSTSLALVGFRLTYVVAELPYKKKIVLKNFFDNYTMYGTIINQSHVPIRIVEAGLIVGKARLFVYDSEHFKKPIKLRPYDGKTFRMNEDLIKKNIGNFKTNQMIYMYVKDTTCVFHKKKVGTVKEILTGLNRIQNG